MYVITRGRLVHIQYILLLLSPEFSVVEWVHVGICMCVPVHELRTLCVCIL